MKKILLVFGSGGHAEQALRLAKDLQNFNVEVVVEKEDPASSKKFSGYKIHKITALRGKKENLFTTLYRIIFCGFGSLALVIKANPDVIISTGPGLAVPICYFSKLFGKKIIFIESWSRVTTKSFAGRFIYPLADKFFVQWPQMKKIYPKALYEGRLG